MVATAVYSKTLTELTQDVIRRLSQVPGTSTQIYAEDRIAGMINHKFVALFDEEFWEHLTHWYTATLDGTVGIPNADLTALTLPLKLFGDIDAVYPGGESKPIPRSPQSRNPNLFTGTKPRFIEPYNEDGRVFRVRPATATGTLEVHYRSRPEEYTANDVVNFDNQAIILGTTYDYLEDDGTNPGATEKFKNMFEARVRQLKKNRSNLPHASDTRTDQTLEEWREQ